MNEHFEPFIKIGKMLSEKSSESGLHMLKFSVEPGLYESTHRTIGLFILPEDQEIEIVVDTEFEELLEQQAKVNQEEQTLKAREALQELSETLKDPKKGIGLD